MHRNAVCLLLLFCCLPACTLRRGADPAPTPPVTLTPAASAAATGATATATRPFLPTPPATAAPPATRAYDPALPDWTLLVYMAADNSLASAALRDLNEMEAAAGSPRLNVVVQIDSPAAAPDGAAGWGGARRLRISPDDDPTVVSSPTLADLGELNMGAPAALQEFIVWGSQTFPANRTALILWDHGAGWQGLAFDDGETDQLTLPELETAVSQAIAQTGLPGLDVIAFDACLMGQLDVLQAVQPYARYAVGSAELTPGAGWDYQALLTNLASEPEQDGRKLAWELVNTFANYYTQVDPDDFVTMTAVDLQRLPPLTHAVEQLAAALLADPAFAAPAVGDARSGTEQFARAYSGAQDGAANPSTAIDLGHFAAILAQRSPDPLVQETAAAVQAAIDQAIVAHSVGRGFRHSRGIAAYFPQQSAAYQPAYGRVTRLTTWQRFLNSYYDVGLSNLAPPEVNLAGTLRDVVGVQMPAYVNFEIVGRQIDAVQLVGGRYEADGRRRLLEFDTLIPEPTLLPDGSRLTAWRDGLHEDFFVWDTLVTYLYDRGGSGGFVVMWPAADGALFAVPGELRRATDGAAYPASLVFDHRIGELVRVWGGQAGETAVGTAELTPQPGDTFQVTEFYLDAANRLVQQPGGTLTFDDDARLYFDWRPLPDGRYFLGFAAANAAGAQGSALTDLTISNSTAVPGYRGYLDPYLGFQFLYPDDWYAPVYSGTLLYTRSLSGTTLAQLTLYPNLDRGATAQTLRNEALFHFGSVDVLFEEEVAVAGLRGIRTAYGYENSAGEARTGIFFTVVSGGTGYVVDVDGPLAAEAETITAVDTLIASWQFTGAGQGVPPGAWASVQLDTFTVPKPTDFVFQPTNSWQRFSADRDTFVALRTQPATRPAADVLAALVRDAGAGVSAFEADAPRRFALGAAAWQRVDFSYTRDGKPIWGFILVRLTDGQEIVAWAEAPQSVYADLEQRVFLVMIADMALP